MYILASVGEALELNNSVFVVMALFVAYHLLMKWLFYTPLFRVFEERERRTSGKLEEAARTEVEYEQMLATYEAGIKEARLEGYALMDAARDKAQKRQQEIIATVQTEVREMVEQSRRDVDATRQEEMDHLSDQVQAFAGMMAGKILARELQQ